MNLCQKMVSSTKECGEPAEYEYQPAQNFPNSLYYLCGPHGDELAAEEPVIVGLYLKKLGVGIGT